MAKHKYRPTQQTPQEPSVPRTKIRSALARIHREDEISRLERLILLWPNNGRYKTHLRDLLEAGIDG